MIVQGADFVGFGESCGVGVHWFIPLLSESGEVGDEAPTLKLKREIETRPNWSACRHHRGDDRTKDYEANNCINEEILHCHGPFV